ncbi:MAG: ATP-grasp domain-containing protein [Methanobacteriaceae archaeon]|jgi:carbamoylphosphate synthase large subunit|nr:ATP-grasp domain-containing protein [Methanobacteriaceae archaeon]OPY22451.1 MAG: 3-methylornithine--L-lysine ligase [Methanobacterium sp. PtaU1.Bin097]
MKILFIGARLFNEVANFARSKGIETILTESNPDSPNLDLADEYHIVPRGMEKPTELALREDVDAVIPLIGIDKPLPEVAVMKKELEENHNLPVVASGIRATEISTDKYQTKKFLMENKLKTPWFTELTRDQISPELKYPVVLKQSEGQGGVGVKIALSPENTEDYLERYPQAMAEEYVKGAEISVEVLRWNNKSVPLVGVYKGDTTLTGTHPLEKTRSAPVDIEDLDNQELRKIAKKIMDKMDGNGTAEVEFIYDTEKKEINTLEINTRPSGTRFLTFCSSNINPIHQLVNMAVGEWNPQKIEREMKDYCALEMPLPSETLSRNPHLKNDDNQKKQILTLEKPYIIHGPEKASRITVRSQDMDQSLKIMETLKIVEK